MNNICYLIQICLVRTVLQKWRKDSEKWIVAGGEMWMGWRKLYRIENQRWPWKRKSQEFKHMGLDFPQPIEQESWVSFIKLFRGQWGIIWHWTDISMRLKFWLPGPSWIEAKKLEMWKNIRKNRGTNIRIYIRGRERWSTSLELKMKEF